MSREELDQALAHGVRVVGALVPEGHVDDVGCPCGPIVHPVDGLLHQLVDDTPDVDEETLWRLVGREPDTYPSADQMLAFLRSAGPDLGREVAGRLIDAWDTAADCLLRHRRTTWTSEGALIIAHERSRQITDEGWTPEHDAEHDRQELARAAACYALPPGERTTVVPPRWWPWRPEDWKPEPYDRVHELAKAGALIAAEIDRLRRSP